MNSSFAFLLCLFTVCVSSSCKTAEGATGSNDPTIALKKSRRSMEQIPSVSLDMLCEETLDRSVTFENSGFNESSADKRQADETIPCIEGSPEIQYYALSGSLVNPVTQEIIPGTQPQPLKFCTNDDSVQLAFLLGPLDYSEDFVFDCSNLVCAEVPSESQMAASAQSLT